MDILELGKQFENKVVSFGIATDTMAIKNPKFSMQIDKLFITGEIPKSSTENDWAVKQPCAIDWNAVTEYIIFDSEKEYVKLMALSEAESVNNED